MQQPIEEYGFTYDDYCEWEGRWELIDGVPYALAAPLQVHQEILSELHRQLANFLKDKPYKVFPAPFDVRLNADTYDDSDTVPVHVLDGCTIELQDVFPADDGSSADDGRHAVPTPAPDLPKKAKQPIP